MDSFGATFVYAHQRNALKQTQEIQTVLGKPLGGSAMGIETREMILEAEYSAHIFRGIDLGPDFQYIIRLGASDRYRNAVVLGLQGNVKFLSGSPCPIAIAAEPAALLDGGYASANWMAVAQSTLIARVRCRATSLGKVGEVLL